MNVRKELGSRIALTGSFANDIEVDENSIKVVMINEVVPLSPLDDFYSRSESEYAMSASLLFERAGAPFFTPEEALVSGVYITNAIKWPKKGTDVPRDLIDRSIPIL